MTEFNETEPLWVGMDVDAELARTETEPPPAPATGEAPRPKRPRGPRALRGAITVIGTPAKRLPLTA